MSASIYLNYFTTKHDEKLIDLWFKSFIPLIRDQPSNIFRENKKLKEDIMNGIPVPMRGHAWIALVRNELRISSHLFHVFKEMQCGTKLNPLVEEDIPRTFPHLNDLFEEI